MTIQQYKEENVLVKDYELQPDEYVEYFGIITDGVHVWPLVYTQDGQWIDYFEIPAPATDVECSAPVLAKYNNVY